MGTAQVVIALVILVDAHSESTPPVHYAAGMALLVAAVILVVQAKRSRSAHERSTASNEPGL